MPSRMLRFVQASDFRLEQTPHGLAEVPEHLTETLIESAYRAAAGVFDLALAEEVDFLVLAGNLVEPERSGPRGPTFLTQQFARLAARGIRVYWAASPDDGRRNWPVSLIWPDNVHVFDSRRVESVVHLRGGEPLCVLFGRSIDQPDERSSHEASVTTGILPFDPLSDLRALCSSLAFNSTVVGGATAATTASGAATGIDLLHIAVSPVSYSASAFESALAGLPASAPPCYLAFGGASSSSTPVVRKQPFRMAHCSGSPQGRWIGETGAHGATVIEVDPPAAVRTIARITDTLRWHDERITLPAAAQRPELERRLHERMQSLIAAAPERTLLVRWTIDGPNSLVTRARQTGVMTEVLAMLRAEYGLRTPAAWSLSVNAEQPAALPETWYEQQTLLGEFLRSIRALDAPGAAGPALHHYLPERLQSAASAAGMSLEDPSRRTATLREAAQLGAELLRPFDTAY